MLRPLAHDSILDQAQRPGVQEYDHPGSNNLFPGTRFSSRAVFRNSSVSPCSCWSPSRQDRSSSTRPETWRLTQDSRRLQGQRVLLCPGSTCGDLPQAPAVGDGEVLICQFRLGISKRSGVRTFSPRLVDRNRAPDDGDGAGHDAPPRSKRSSLSVLAEAKMSQTLVKAASFCCDILHLDR